MEGAIACNGLIVVRHHRTRMPLPWVVVAHDAGEWGAMKQFAGQFRGGFFSTPGVVVRCPSRWPTPSSPNPSKQHPKHIYQAHLSFPGHSQWQLLSLTPSMLLQPKHCRYVTIPNIRNSKEEPPRPMYVYQKQIKYLLELVHQSYPTI